jgi:hypothetical protein
MDVVDREADRGRLAGWQPRLVGHPRHSPGIIGALPARRKPAPGARGIFRA